MADFDDDRRRENARDVASGEDEEFRETEDASASGESSGDWRFFDSVVGGDSLASVYRQVRDGMRNKRKGPDAFVCDPKVMAGTPVNVRVQVSRRRELEYEALLRRDWSEQVLRCCTAVVEVL